MNALGMKPSGRGSQFDEHAGDYAELLDQGLAVSGEPIEYFAEGRVRWLGRQLAAAGLPSGRVIDFGCGTGTAIPYLSRTLRPVSLCGVDVSEESLRAAGDKYGKLASFALNEELSSTWDADVAYCNGVFHHIPVPERAAAMRQVFELLKPGGVFSLWENNPFNPGTRYVMSRIPFDRDAVMLWPRQARKLARAQGFEVLRTDFLFVFPKFLAPLRGVEPLLHRLPLGAQYHVLLRKPRV